MRFSEARSLIGVRRPVLDPVDRALRRCVTVDDLQRAAHRRWPRGVIGYVEGGADDEVSVARNRQAFESYSFRPSVLRDVADVDTSTSLLGSVSDLPFALAPTGYTRMMHADGEIAVARAAREANVPYTLSTMATTSIEEVAQACPGELWFQLYVWRDRQLMADLVRRAAVSGYRVLMVTVDTAVSGLRVRDAHHGFTIPPRLDYCALLDMAAHPRWWRQLLAGAPITFANIPGHQQDPSGVMSFASRQFDPSVTWSDLEDIRDLWSGPLVVKGLSRPDDVIMAASIGADGVVLSNHGGRQLDQSEPPILGLRAARDAVGDELEILVDSGIRRGTDLAIAMAYGASGCLVGRPYLYGLGAGGERGVRLSIELLGEELRRAMQLLGVATIDQLRAEGPSLVRRAAAMRADAIDTEALVTT